MEQPSNENGLEKRGTTPVQTLKWERSIVKKRGYYSCNNLEMGTIYIHAEAKRENNNRPTLGGQCLYLFPLHISITPKFQSTKVILCECMAEHIFSW